MPKGVYDHHKIRGQKMTNRRSYFGEDNPKYRHGYAVGGLSHLYMVWSDMKRRATNPKHQRAIDYVLRGITVCDEWLDFKNFSEWAEKNGYQQGLTIDRKDNDKGYCPDNCRFVTNAVNCRNSRQTKINISIAAKIKRLLSAGLLQKKIAEMCNCSKWIVQDISQGRTWKDVQCQ
jgi:hypothetical protein